MRSLLFVPGDSDRKLAKALTTQADCLLIDLEDAIAPDAKAQARERTARFLSELGDAKARPPIYVRINAFATGLAEADLDAVVPAAPEGIVQPKPRSGEDVRALAAMLDERERKAGMEVGALGILPLATETPQALFAMHSFADCGPRLKALTWGAEDLADAVGADRNRDENGAYTAPFELARSLTLFAAAAAGVPAIDTVFTDFRDDAGLAREAARAARDGFTGKLAIHPAQVPILNEAFTPSAQDIDDAREIVAAFDAAGGAGAVGFKGRMLDRPHIEKARRTLAQAQLAGTA